MSTRQQFDKVWDAGDVLTAGGSAVVANDQLTDRSMIFLQRRILAGGVAGNLTPVITPGVGFTVQSTSANEVSLVSYMIIENDIKLRTL